MTNVAPLVPDAAMAIVEESMILIVDPVAAEAAGYDAFLSRVRTIMDSVADRYTGDVTAAVSSRESTEANLSELYNQVRARITGAFYQTGDALIRPESSHSAAPFLDESPQGEPALVAEQLVSTSHDAALAELERTTSGARVHPERVREFARRVCDQLQILAGGASVSVPRVRGVMRFTAVIDRLRTGAELVRASREESGEISARGEINRVARYVREHIREPISAEAMADLAGMSLAHFSRVFKKASGLTFSEYLTHTRIDLAKHKLRTTDDTIDEIARVSGIENVAYFHRVFKRKTGVTPGDFRRRV
jgi:AraC-like DNA-binding protein